MFAAFTFANDVGRNAGHTLSPTFALFFDDFKGPGNPDLADPDLLPPLEEMGAGPDWIVQVGRCQHGSGPAQLLVENLLDLTHVDFLPASALDVDDATNAPVRFSTDRDHIYATRLKGVPWIAGFYDLIFERRTGLTDRTTWWERPDTGLRGTCAQSSISPASMGRRKWIVRFSETTISTIESRLNHNTAATTLRKIVGIIGGKKSI